MATPQLCAMTDDEISELFRNQPDMEIHLSKDEQQLRIAVI